ncbi:hypothetical protein MPSEU_000027200 [Mayamaea pseudoterrestris]|nr:hypothetical protein MPSEU_000027200 [Mayamaea pseudoterrestris]
MSRRKFQPVAKLAMLLLAVALPSSNSTRISFHTSSSIALQRHIRLGPISSKSSPHPRSRTLIDISYIFRVRGGALEDDDDDDVDVDDEAETVITQTSTTQSSAAQDESDSDEDEHIENDDNKDDQSTTIDNSKPLHSALSNEPVPINVTTMLQCSVLDHSLEITAHRSRSVGFLKASLSKQLPGRPPVSMLQLKLGPKILSDELLVDELMDDDDDEDDDDEPEAASSSKLTLVLDMIPPIDVKSAIVSEAKLEELTPSQLLDAFAATEAAMYQNAMLMAQEEQQQQQVENVNADGEEENDEADFSRSTHSSTPVSPTLLVKERAARLRQDMETKLFQSASHQELLAETTPPAHKTLNLQEREVRGQRIRQVAQGGVKTTLRRKMQRNFNVSWADTIRTICLFLFFGYFGGRSPTSRAILLLGAPSVVFLQARPVKVWLRRLLYFALTHPPSIFLSLLPAPQQALLSVDVDHDLAVMYGEYIRDTVGGEVNEQANSGDSDDYDGIVHADQDEYDEYD